MEKIILLKGTSDVGKTQVLNIVIDLLQKISSIYEIQKKYDDSEDRLATFYFSDKTVCVCTAGDDSEIVKKYFKYFDKQNCDIAVCTAHVSDESKKEFDKNVKDMEIETIEFRKRKDKNLDYSGQLVVAREVAAKIFNKVLNFCYDEI